MNMINDLPGEVFSEEEVLLLLADIPFWTDGDGNINVPEQWACPACQESHIDMLVWDDDGEYVACSSCGTVYVPESTLRNREEK